VHVLSNKLILECLRRAIQDEMTAELATEKESHLLAAEKVKSLEFEVESLRHNLAVAKAHLEQSESSRVSSEREAAELATKLGFSEEKLKARETDVEALRLEKVNAAQTLAELRTQVTNHHVRLVYKVVKCILMLGMVSLCRSCGYLSVLADVSCATIRWRFSSGPARQ